MLPFVKRVKIGPHGMCAVGIIALAISLRVVLTALGWPPTNSDESTMGLMAIHIASLKDFPTFMYGQLYMGAFEAYLAAALFHLFGTSLFTLRLAMMLIYTFFLVSMYLLTSLLYTKTLALVTLALLSLGSIMMVFTELMAHGGYPEILCFGTLALLLASYLAYSSDQYPPPHKQWRRMIAFGCWGLVVALGFWSDYAILSILLMSGLLLVLFCWRELLKGAIWPLLLGLVTVGFPLIIYNLKSPLGQNTLAVMLGLHNSHSLDLAQSPLFSHFPILAQIGGTLLFSLPMATGGPPSCFDSGWVLLGHGGGISAFGCFDIQGNWGLVAIALCWSIGYILLWMMSAFHELRILWKLKQHPAERPLPPIKRQAMIRHFARLVLLGSAALTLLQYTSSPVSAIFPAAARYLTGLLIATPAIIAPLWGLSRDLSSRGGGWEDVGWGGLPRPCWFHVVLRLFPHRQDVGWGGLPRPRLGPSGSAWHLFSVPLAPVKLALRWSALLFVGVVLLLGTISIFFELPTVQAVEQQQQVLIRDLLRIKATHIYTDYWTCNRLAFLSREQIICAVLGDQMQETHNRVPGYYSIVKADPHSAYVFPVGSPQAIAIEKQAALSTGYYQRFVFDGYVIFQPVGSASVRDAP